MLIPRGLFVIGVGSHARSVADVALDLGVPALTFVDPSARCGQKFAGFPVVTAISELPDGWLVLAAAGDTSIANGRSRSRSSGTLTHLAWVEADLSYPDDTMEALLAHDKPIIAPWIYLNSVFYDSGDFATKTARELLRSNLTFPTHPTNRSS